MTDHINLQKQKSSKIYACIKMGANRTDQNFIKQLQKQGLNEHEIQSESGIHYTVVQGFMSFFDEKFKPTDAPITPETKALHERIAELESKESEVKPEETPKKGKGKK